MAAMPYEVDIDRGQAERRVGVLQSPIGQLRHQAEFHGEQFAVNQEWVNIEPGRYRILQGGMVLSGTGSDPGGADRQRADQTE